MGMETSKKKLKYRIRNWKQYNQALVNRGRIDLWINVDVQDAWYEPEKTGKRGASKTFSDLAIQTMLTLKEVYHLPFRAVEGFLGSILDLLDLSLESPDYSTGCRRRKDLLVHIPRRVSGNCVYVEGETHA